MSEEVAVEAAEATTEATTTEAVVEQAPEWSISSLLEGADEEISGNKYWQKFDGADKNTVLKSIIEREKLVGYKGDIPKPDATPEEWAEFNKKLGVPGDASEYGLKAPEGISDDVIGKLAEMAHKHNLTPKQTGLVSDILEYYNGLEQEAAQAQEESEQKSLESLNKEWGDAKDEMAAAVQNLEKHYGMSEEAMDAIESNPETLILLGKIAKDLDEKGQVGTVFNSTRQGLSDQIREKEGELINLLSTNPEDARIQRLQEDIANLRTRNGDWLK